MFVPNSAFLVTQLMKLLCKKRLLSGLRIVKSKVVYQRRHKNHELGQYSVRVTHLWRMVKVKAGPLVRVMAKLTLLLTMIIQH